MELGFFSNFKSEVKENEEDDSIEQKAGINSILKEQNEEYIQKE